MSSSSTSIKILSGTRLEHCNVISIIDSIKSKAHRAETHIIKRCLGFELLQQVPHNSRLGGCCPSIRLRGADVSYLSLIYIVMTESSLCRISTPLFLQSTHIAWIQVNCSLIRIKGKSRVYVTPPCNCCSTIEILIQLTGHTVQMKQKSYKTIPKSVVVPCSKIKDQRPWVI